MNILYTTVLFLLTLSSCANSLRWGRIAQREHYIPGYVTKFYFRWVRLVPFNNLDPIHCISPSCNQSFPTQGLTI